MTLVDTNVPLDLLTGDAKWTDWSIEQLDTAALRGPLAINDVVYAELSVRFATIEALDAVVAEISGGVVSGGEGVPAISSEGWNARRGVAGCLHRRACGGAGVRVAQQKCGAVPDILSRD